MSERERLLRVSAVDDLPPGERTIVEREDGPAIGVFNIDGEYYALENRCAHQGGPVCDGLQQGAVVGEFVEPGKRVKESFSDDVPAIACPWHGWEYDVRTGEHLGDPEYGIEAYDVVVDDGTIYVEL